MGADKMLKEMLGDSLTPLLKARGFRKQALTWNRREGDVVQVFDIQPSRWNDDAKEEFTINVGGVSRFAWETCWGKKLPKHVAIEECCPTFRIGEILNDFAPQANDKWWCLTRDLSDAVIETIQDEVIEVTRRKCLPLLDELDTECDLLRTFERLPEATRKQPANRLYYAILLAHNGRKSEAEEELLGFEDPKLRAWDDRAVTVKTRLGFRVP